MVAAADVFDFLAHQRGDRKVVRISDDASGLSARTIADRFHRSLGSTHTWLLGATRRWEPTPSRVTARRLRRALDRSARCGNEPSGMVFGGA